MIPVFPAFALLLAGPVIAAPPTVPASLPYQGLLLDGLGQPRNGTIDLTVRVFDAVFGGTLVYKQSFPAVSLADGVFSVQLGPSGEASDAPTNPLTTDLATALGGDAGATSPVRFLEVTVGTDGALTRTQILSSAYALRASTATMADSATTATTAVTAQNASNLGGRAAGFFDQYFANTNLDNNSGPGNDDPREGLLDSDGDGLANFLDVDNDNDGLDDSAEISLGFDINLVTPRVTTVTPSTASFLDTTAVTVQGTGFQPGLSVVFGSQTPAPSNLTATSFDVTVGPQGPSSANVTVTNTNGQTSIANAIFLFASSLAHLVPLGASQTTLAALPGTSTLALGGKKQYGVGTAAQLLLTLGSKGVNGQLGVAWNSAGALSAVRCRDLGTSCAVEIVVDSDADRILEEETGIPIETLATGSNPQLLAADLMLDASNRWVSGYVRRTITSEAVVAHDRNGDGLFSGPGEVALVESGLSATNPIPAEVAVDASGRAALAYVTGTANVRFAWDRNNDGDFVDVIGGNPEVTTLSTLGSSCIGAAFDGAGHPAVIYSSGPSVYLARDLNDDGDFADAGESPAVAGVSSSGCDVAYKSGQPLAVAYNAGTVHLRLDKNNDGDFADTGEDTVLDKAGGAEMELTLNGANRAFMAVNGFILIGVTD